MFRNSKGLRRFGKLKKTKNYTQCDTWWPIIALNSTIFLIPIVEPVIFNNEADAGGGLEYMPNYYNEQAKEDIPDSDWYVPQGAIPQGFELEENLGKKGNQQPVNFQPDYQSQPINFQPDFQPQPVDVQTHLVH